MYKHIEAPRDEARVGPTAVRALLKQRWVEPHAALVQFADGTYGRCTGIYKASEGSAVWQVTIAKAASQRVACKMEARCAERDESRDASPARHVRILWRPHQGRGRGRYGDGRRRQRDGRADKRNVQGHRRWGGIGQRSVQAARSMPGGLRTPARACLAAWRPGAGGSRPRGGWQELRRRRRLPQIGNAAEGTPGAAQNRASTWWPFPGCSRRCTRRASLRRTYARMTRRAQLAASRLMQEARGRDLEKLLPDFVQGV